MPVSLDTAHAAIIALVNTFQQNQARYLSPAYQEAEARKDFIDKFWKALGWDVDHDAQTNPAEQEVKIERGVAVATAQKRADYAFFLAPNYRDVRFFVEAKKPSVDLNQNADAYFQTVRYGWNANTPLAVLTDFEQFHVLDCRAKPDIRTATQRAHKTYRYTDFLNRETFAEVYWLFSREALATGAFDRYITTLPKPKEAARQYKLPVKGFQAVDASFLDELEQHRETLAKAFKRDNPALDGYTLTEITHRTLDRLVFLRFLEDKLIETEITVDAIANHAAPWAEFVTESKRLNARYNGAVYKLHPLIDTGKLKVSGDDFAEVCRALSSAHSPYNFNVIPIHILGSIYERFLGKVIVATDKRARVEEKPEVRKAGGVYYTPEYIVRYIVDQTVGKLIEGKTPAEIAKLRFADIACGSGSFLLTVFDTLLRYHTRWYNEHPDRAARAGCVQTEDGAWRLSLKQRRDILLNNVYGVDIDAQAVDVTQVSLYLKLLEEETTASSHQYEMQFRETLLPNLGSNIVCGNSLIGTDILHSQMFASEEERALNPMDFEAAFPQVMRAGGFDAIVGNPPYVRMEEFKPLKNYLSANYQSHADRADLYVYFLERESNLLKRDGLLGIIVSNKFIRANYGRSLRNTLTSNLRINEVLDFAGLPVFHGATVRTIILIATKGANSSYCFTYLPPLDIQTFDQIESGIVTLTQVTKDRAASVSSSALTTEAWTLVEQSNEQLLTKLKVISHPLNTYCASLIGMGIKSGLNEAFIIDQAERDLLVARNRNCEKHLRPFLNGREIRRYRLEPKGQFLIYAHHGVDFKDCPELIERMQPFKSALQKRATKQEWFELQQPQFRYMELLSRPKVIFPDMAIEPRFALDRNSYFCANTCYFIGKDDLYLLGLLNSKIGLFYFRLVCAGLEGKGETYLRFFGQYLEGFPIRPINFDDPTDKAKHDKMVSLVEQMLDAKQKQAAAQSERDSDYYTRRCAQLDQQIDALVYDLYGLTEDEIAIVEGRAA